MNFALALDRFVSFSHHAMNKKRHLLKEGEDILCGFSMIVLGTFCATCTATGYPCYSMLEKNIKIFYLSTDRNNQEII